MVGADTVQRPGGRAAVVRVHGTRKALAMVTECTPRYCLADPYEGGKQAVVAAYRRLIAVGAKPLAVTDCLNFGNPENPVVMGQLVGCIEGMAEACRALDFPVVSGNVSLYNDTEGRPIPPTPQVGAVGLIEDWAGTMTMGFKAEGEEICVIGGSSGYLGKHGTGLDQSLHRAGCGILGGRPPVVQLDVERRVCELVRTIISGRLVTAVHDVSDGGLAGSLTEMALAGGIGLRWQMDDYGWDLITFNEAQSRFVVTTRDWMRIWELAREADVLFDVIGETGGDEVACEVHDGTPWSIPLAQLRAAHEGWLPAVMA